MTYIQILHILHQIVKEKVCIGVGRKLLTHIFTTIRWTAPSMDQKCKLPLADPDPPLSSTLSRPPNSLFAHQKAGGQIRDHEVVGK